MSMRQLYKHSLAGILSLTRQVYLRVLLCSCLFLHTCLFYKDVLQPGVQNVGAAPQPVPAYAPQPTPMPGYSQTAAYPVYPVQAGNKIVQCLLKMSYVLTSKVNE